MSVKLYTPLRVVKNKKKIIMAGVTFLFNKISRKFFQISVNRVQTKNGGEGGSF